MDKTEAVGRIIKIMRKHLGILACKIPTRYAAMEIYDKLLKEGGNERNGRNHGKGQRHDISTQAGGGDGRRHSPAGQQGAQGPADR